MIQRGSTIIVADNSGGRRAKCISIYNSYKYITANFEFQGIIHKLRSKRRSIARVKYGKFYKMLITRINRPYKRNTGFSVMFPTNECIVLGKHNEPMASRVFCGVSKELRIKRKSKLFVMASFIY